MIDLEQHRALPAVSLEAAIVARRYYVDDKQKNEIAEELGLSRFKVARLLEEARASGIVRIYVDMPSEIDLPLGELLARKFGIQRAIIVRSLERAPETTPSVVGAAAAEYASSILTDGDVLGISWGSSLTALVDAVTTLPKIDIVQLVGGVSSGQMDVSGVELVRRLSEKAGGRAFPLHAPLLVSTPEMAQALRSDPSLSDTISRFASLKVALVGIGSWTPPKSSLYDELTVGDRRELLAEGAVADMCSIVFDINGKPIDSPVLGRSLGIGVHELKEVPEVIAVAAGAHKIAAIAAVLRSRIVDSVVTDQTTAHRLLEQ